MYLRLNGKTGEGGGHGRQEIENKTSELGKILAIEEERRRDRHVGWKNLRKYLYTE